MTNAWTEACTNVGLMGQLAQSRADFIDQLEIMARAEEQHATERRKLVAENDDMHTRLAMHKASIIELEQERDRYKVRWRAAEDKLTEYKGAIASKISRETAEDTDALLSELVRRIEAVERAAMYKVVPGSLKYDWRLNDAAYVTSAAGTGGSLPSVGNPELVSDPRLRR